MSRIMAAWIVGHGEAGAVLVSFARRKHLQSHAKLCFTIHRLGSAWKPTA